MTSTGYLGWVALTQPLTQDRADDNIKAVDNGCIVLVMVPNIGVDSVRLEGYHKSH